MRAVTRARGPDILFPRHAPRPFALTCTQPETIQLRTNLEAIRLRIDRAAQAAGRRDEVQLLPVTKAVSVEVARALVSLGEVELAENRADELVRKAEAIDGVRWHFIGHLQRNKARRIVQHASVLHSVDSVRLLETLGRICEEEGRALEVYLQVDLTREATKTGLGADELPAALEISKALPSLSVRGLMAMAPLHETDGHDAAAVFAAVAALRERTREQALASGLSMGMSRDLEAAVAAGSTCVRIGTDLYRGVSE